MQLSLLLFYEFLFLVVTLKQFMIISGGIIPYCLYIYLKDAEE